MEHYGDWACDIDIQKIGELSGAKPTVICCSLMIFALRHVQIVLPGNEIWSKPCFWAIWIFAS